MTSKMEDLKKLNKNKKMVKKLADSFDAFVASQVGPPKTTACFFLFCRVISWWCRTCKENGVFYRHM